MEKRNLWLGFGIVLAILVIALLVRPQLFSQVQESPYEREVGILFDRVRTEVSRLRGLPPPDGARVEVVGADYFGNLARESYDEDALKVQEALYRGLLLVPGDFSLLQKRVGQAGTFLAATVGKTIYVVREHFDPADNRQALRVLAHEYVHVLQYVHIRQRELRTEDGLRAWTAFIEGEADLVADMYLAEITGVKFSPGVPRPLAIKPEGADAGWALDMFFAFPYAYGENFVYQLYLEGGWDEVNRAYQDPPSSSAQILHLERYLAGIEPVPVPLPEPVRGGWSLSHPERLGVYSALVLLLQKLPPAVAVDAASGWAGDNLALYLDHGTYLLFWGTLWRDEGSASAFEGALLSLFERMGGVRRDGSFWDFGGRLMAARRTGRTVTLVGSSDAAILSEEL